MRGSPASLMTRGYQGIKAYYIVFANARFMYIAWELSTLLSNVETCSTSWSLRVSQARSLHRLTKIRIDPALLSESMASLMDGSPTTSRVHVQRRSSALYHQKQLRQAGAGAAGGAAAKKNFAMRSENDRLRSDTEADTSTISAKIVAPQSNFYRRSVREAQG
jgi:hypothetical protein